MSKEEEKTFQQLQDDYYTNNEDGYIGAQYQNTLESTKALCEFIKSTVNEDDNLSFLDAGCGDGSLINHFMQHFPNSSFTGFDISHGMVDFARKKLPSKVKIDHGDLLKMDRYSKEKYDIVYTVHTYSLFSDFEEVSQQLINCTRSHLFINSLFSKHNVDTLSVISEPNFPPINWNIFSMKRVEEYFMNQGAKKVTFHAFDMPIELQEPKEGMGSYTKKLEDGSYLTFSGPLFLPWYFLRVDFI